MKGSERGSVDIPSKEIRLFTLFSLPIIKSLGPWHKDGMYNEFSTQLESIVTHSQISGMYVLSFANVVDLQHHLNDIYLKIFMWTFSLQLHTILIVHPIHVCGSLKQWACKHNSSNLSLQKMFHLLRLISTVSHCAHLLILSHNPLVTFKKYIVIFYNMDR